MPRLHTLSFARRSSSHVIARALTQVTAHLGALGEAIEPANVEAHAHHRACCDAVESLKAALDSCGPPIEWHRMPPHLATVMRELLQMLVDPPKPAKAGLKSHIVKGTFVIAALLVECL